MAESALSVPTRRWEFLYRLLHFSGADVVENAEVMARRRAADVTDDPRQHGFAWEERSASAAEATAVAGEAQAWCELFDQWQSSTAQNGGSSFLFPDVYAVGFFIAVLHCDDAVYCRGQQNAEWGLVTSRTRASTGDPAALRTRDEAAAAFMSKLREDPEVRFFYDGAPPLSEHLVAAARTTASRPTTST